MADIYEPKPGDTIPNWDAPAGPYKCSSSSPTPTRQGDNPSVGGSADLPNQGDMRNFSGPGSSNSNPTEAMPGVNPAGGAPMNPGLRPPGQPYTGETL